MRFQIQDKKKHRALDLVTDNYHVILAGQLHPIDVTYEHIAD